MAVLKKSRKPTLFNSAKEKIMSHALHRHGTTEQLQNDYTFYARASRYVNREGCGPKLRKILSIALSEKKLVNYGSSQAGKSYEAGPEARRVRSHPGQGLRRRRLLLRQGDGPFVPHEAQGGRHGDLDRHQRPDRRGRQDRRRDRPEAPYGLPLPGRLREEVAPARGRGPAGHDDVRPRHGRLQTHEGGDGPGESGER